jgi:hypothetical protein
MRPAARYGRLTPSDQRSDDATWSEPAGRIEDPTYTESATKHDAAQQEQRSYSVVDRSNSSGDRSGQDDARASLARPVGWGGT